MGRLLLVVVMLGLLAVAGVFVVVSWQAMGAVEMSGVGIGALIAGVVLSLVVGGGLMALVFYSARRGYDDAAHSDRPRPAHRRDTPRD